MRSFDKEQHLQAGTIGKLLIDIGKITDEDARKILKHQKSRNIRFGEAAIEMHLITETDIQFALSKQFSYSYLEKDSGLFSDLLEIAYEPFTDKSESIRTLRANINQRWINDGNQVFAITGIDDSEYINDIAANLAVAYSQLGERTLLIDANLRSSSLHDLFKLENKVGLADILANRSDLDAINVIEKLQGLSVLTSGTSVPNPQEILNRRRLPHLLEELKSFFDVIIFTTHPIMSCSDFQPIFSLAKGGVLSVKKDVTRVDDLKYCIEKIKSTSAKVIGVVID